MLASTSLREERVESIVLRQETATENNTSHHNPVIHTDLRNCKNERFKRFSIHSTCRAHIAVRRTYSSSDGLVAWHLSVRLDAMFQAIKLPAGISDLRNTVIVLKWLVDSFLMTHPNSFASSRHCRNVLNAGSQTGASHLDTGLTDVDGDDLQVDSRSLRVQVRSVLV